jgi:hypothetical protein
MTAKISAVGLVIGSTLAATTAFAQTAPAPAPFAFGAPGQIAISSDFWAQVGTHSERRPDGNNPPSTTTVELKPALDVFVMQNFSVGGQVTMTWQKSGGGHSTSLGVGPRVGYDVPITDRISFWPKGGLSVEAQSNQTASGSKLKAFVLAPFLYHPVPHFFVGFGPAFAVDLLSRWDGNAAAKDLDFSLSTTVGGWF